MSLKKVFLILITFISANLVAKSANDSEPVKTKDYDHHFICIGIDSKQVAYELDFFMTVDESGGLSGLWKSAGKYHFVGNGLGIEDGNLVFHFSSKDPREPIDGIQYYQFVDNSYLLGNWTAWTQDDESNKITGKETCIKI